MMECSVGRRRGVGGVAYAQVTPAYVYVCEAYADMVAREQAAA
jgi:hypothetical protein